MSQDHHGGCACGALRYTTTGHPAKAGACHCRYCQLRTGSAFGVSAYFEENAVEIRGDRRAYAFSTESDRTFTTHFCPTCGTSVFWTLDLFPDLVGIAAGTFDPPTFWFRVDREVFTRSKPSFVHLDVEHRFETSPSYAPACQDLVARMGS